MIEQSYSGPDRPILPAIQMISAHAGGIRFHATSRRLSLAPDARFTPPRRMSLGFELPSRPATRWVTLRAAGVAPIRLRGHIWPPTSAMPGAVYEIRDRRQILALLENRDWTALFRNADGSVQHTVPFRMPVDLETARSLRARQSARMREAARDPATRCTELIVEDEAGII